MGTNITEFDGLGSSIDVLLAGMSFEDRCTALTKYITSDSVNHVILFKNTDIAGSERNTNAENCLRSMETKYKIILNFLHSSNITVDTVLSQHRNMKRKMEAVKEVLDHIRKKCVALNRENICIGVDTTCFTRIDLIILLDYLFDVFPSAQIRIIYVSPKDHAGDWLTRGYSGLDSILGFPGEMDYLKKKALVILSGFEGERPQNFIEEYEPDVIYMGLSDKDPTCKEFGARNVEIQRRLLSADNVTTFHFSARSIEKCYFDIDQIISPLLKDYNVIIAPLCTKLSVVASFLYAKKHPEIQLSYCYPREYNWEHYSSGISKIYIEEIDRSVL